MKAGIFVGNTIVEDVNRKPAMVMIDLKPIDEDDNESVLKFNIAHTFDIILQDLYKQYSEEELLESFLFMAFFK